MGNDAEKGIWRIYTIFYMSFIILDHIYFQGFLAVTPAVCWRCGAWYLGVHILYFANWDVVEFTQCIPNLLTKCLVTVYDIV
jgi:hypothetical protein